MKPNTGKLKRNEATLQDGNTGLSASAARACSIRLSSIRVLVSHWRSTFGQGFSSSTENKSQII